ncbi:PAS domain-containing protein [Litoribacter populi]|uniref:PAS domain-containing protein n=1 Tax=Litoribacter populi TaxID=2598460 RepID=UPI00117F4875|nr:PAS domain-containing protein [Litoribacter populi]
MEIMCLDVYLAHMARTTTNTKIKIDNTPQNPQPPLLSWDVYSLLYMDILEDSGKNADIQKLRAFTDKINPDFDCEFIMAKDYSALVFTDAQQIIKWVSPGFTKMTGYAKSFAIGKSPSFLQGPRTSSLTRQQVKNNLENGQTSKEILVNYKADNTEYFCEIEIHPINNQWGKLEGFLALETELRDVG